MKRTPAPFDSNVDRWLQYSESQKGRLRQNLTWYNLERHLESLKEPLRVLDAGCGLGELASLLLPRAGDLVLVDFSEKMLEKARSRLLKRHSRSKRGKLRFIQCPMEELDDCLPGSSFHLILSHTLLEYVESPEHILRALVERLVHGGLLSLVAVNCFSEAFKLALAKNDLTGARKALFKKDFRASLFGDVPKQTFSFEDLAELLHRLRLKIIGRYGIRIFADYMPDEVLRDPTSYGLLYELEKEASKLSPFLHVARYLHLICMKKDD